MGKCDKSTTDPAKHAGPFKFEKVVADSLGVRLFQSCTACGQMVVRPVKGGLDPPPEGQAPPRQV